MKSIGTLIKEARKSAGLTQQQLSEKVKLSRSYIGDIEKDRYNPSVSTLKLIAEATNTPLENLLVSKQIEDKGGVRIPVLGRIVAGIPIEAIEDVIDWEEIPISMARTGDYFALMVTGRSMEPTLRDGDVVILKKQSDVDNGDIAAVLINGNEATIKEIKKGLSGITLIGHNVVEYSPTFYSNEDIERLPISILGKAVELRRKF